MTTKVTAKTTLSKKADRRVEAVGVAMPPFLKRAIDRAAFRCECSFSRAVMLAVVHAWKDVDPELEEDFAIWCNEKGYDYENV